MEMLPSTSRPIPGALREFLRRRLPGAYSRLRFRRALGARFEAEIALIPALCYTSRVAIDVGAANGIYSMNMSQIAASVVAFEPRPTAAADLRMIAEMLGLNIEVREVALSDQQSLETLRVPRGELGRSTIEPENDLSGTRQSEVELIQIPTEQLDAIWDTDVGMMKIDVEGHELAVLTGGAATIERCRPNVLIEVEERHKPGSVAAVTKFFADRNYAGFFIFNNNLTSIEEFAPLLQRIKTHVTSGSAQRPRVYVNNFIFIPKEHSETAVPAIDRCLDGAAAQWAR